jgi:cytochrome c-type biogenesis protein CcmH
MTVRENATRREFLGRVVAVVTPLALGADAARAQGRAGSAKETTPTVDSSNLFAMDQSAAKSVRLPPKPDARPSMTADERDEFEHRIRCQCGCTLDVYTCRTTDFSCRVSPAMHSDIAALVAGGHGAQEIIDAFVTAYGERALMAPRKSGFNLLGWWAPAVAVAVGAVSLAAWLRSRRGTGDAAAPHGAGAAAGVDATPEELARVEAAVRGDE